MCQGGGGGGGVLFERKIREFEPVTTTMLEKDLVEIYFTLSEVGSTLFYV